MTEVHILRPHATPVQTLPHSVEAEQQLLGCMLITPHIIGAVARAGGADLFMDPLHARVCAAALEKDAAGHLVSPVTIASAMQADEGLQAIGAGYLARMAGAAISPAGAQAYIDMLADMATKRRIAGILDDARAAITRNDESAALIARRVEGSMLTLELPGAADRPVSLKAAVAKAIDMANAAYQGEDDGAVRSGIASLDTMIGGFYPGELTLIGGRPSMGKTAVALTMAMNAARAGHGVVIASLEMNPEAMAVRAISEATAQAGRGVDYANIRRGDMQPDDFRHAITTARAIADLPITFLPRNYSDIGALYAGAKAARRAMGDNMRLLIVDYAQLLRSKAQRRYEQITEISIALKAMAGTLNIPVVALSQLSRDLEKREDKRPQLSDLRESGQLEQDADCVIFCFRHEYYLDRERPGNDDMDAMADWQAAMEKAHRKLELIVAKQRQGAVGTARALFNPATNLIWEAGPHG